jgi:hypothetical protein
MQLLVPMPVRVCYAIRKHYPLTLPLTFVGTYCPILLVSYLAYLSTLRIEVVHSSGELILVLYGHRL